MWWINRTFTHVDFNYIVKINRTLPEENHSITVRDIAALMLVLSIKLSLLMKKCSKKYLLSDQEFVCRLMHNR